MMGIFFLLFSIAPAYWANYNYGESNRTKELLRRWSQQPELMPKDSYGGNPFAIQTSRLERYKLEMLLSGAGGLLLLGIASLFFVKSFRARKIKPHYELIDWRKFPMPTQRIEVRQKRLYDLLFAFIVIFFGGLIMLNFAQIVLGKFSTTQDIIIKGFLFNGLCLGLILFITYLTIRAKRKSARFFDASGVLRGDNRHFSWNEFCGVVTRIDINFRRQRKYVWRIELAFADGEAAWIIPQRIKNAEEVFQYLAALPPANLENI